MSQKNAVLKSFQMVDLTPLLRIVSIDMHLYIFDLKKILKFRLFSKKKNLIFLFDLVEIGFKKKLSSQGGRTFLDIIKRLSLQHSEDRIYRSAFLHFGFQNIYEISTFYKKKIFF